MLFISLAIVTPTVRHSYRLYGGGHGRWCRVDPGKRDETRRKKSAAGAAVARHSETSNFGSVTGAKPLDPGRRRLRVHVSRPSAGVPGSQGAHEASAVLGTEEAGVPGSRGRS
ncbi:hypothetical protein NDU88_004799 [Pleurodeles waltl]|uniref:Secreted protein n=1 Tax=Pleurodeles waltl TaxID=8319 RepID=A0AAV7L0G5_PLEWA|nr:hypothetical protein NDU88_004799 [Pleurodeles waltl]